MAKGLNKWMGIGNLGQDPEAKVTTTGKNVANFSLAINESYKDGAGEVQERTEWVNIVAWDKLAEVCSQYLRKGSKIYVEGQMRTRSYDKDGVKVYRTEVHIYQMIMLDQRNTQRQEGDQQQHAAAPTSKSPDNDLPF